MNNTKKYLNKNGYKKNGEIDCKYNRKKENLQCFLDFCLGEAFFFDASSFKDGGDRGFE